MDKASTTSSSSIVDLPVDELVAYGCNLGLTVDATAERGELLRRIRKQQELLLELDRSAMLDVVIWGRVPVRQSASKEELARHIASIDKVNFDALSERGLRTLARLRNLGAHANAPRSSLERRLRHQESFWARYRRRRRRVVGSLISKVLEAPAHEGDYKFLPEDSVGTSLKQSIEESGFVGGIAQKLRGAADEYVHQKLDEIEHRIDRKLDEIDGRLAEWRDQEIRNRLRIVKITLIAAIIVAVLSLGYDYLKARNRPSAETLPVREVIGPEAVGESAD